MIQIFDSSIKTSPLISLSVGNLIITLFIYFVNNILQTTSRYSGLFLSSSLYVVAFRSRYT